MTTAQKPDGLPADLEALMPEPAVRAVYADAYNTPAVKHGFEQGGYLKSPDYFTADQMRELAVAVNERAATICDNIEDGAEFVGETRAARTAEGCAAAIRSGGEAGS